MFQRAFTLFVLSLPTVSVALAQQPSSPIRQGDLVTVRLMGDAGRRFLELARNRVDGQDEADFYLPISAECSRVMNGGLILEGKILRFMPFVGDAAKLNDPQAALKTRRLITFTLSVPFDQIQTEGLPIPNFYHKEDLARYKESMKDKPRPKFVEVRNVKLQAWDFVQEIDVGAVNAGY